MWRNHRRDNRQEMAILGHAHVLKPDKSSPYRCSLFCLAKKAKPLVHLVSELLTLCHNLTKEGLHVLARIAAHVRLCEIEKTIRITKERRR